MTATTRDQRMPQWRAAHARALRLAQRLRDASVVFRRYAGELKYHPQTGVQGRIGQELLDAAAVMRDTLSEVDAITRRWGEEIAWLRSLAHRLQMEDIHQGHAAVRGAARLGRAALDGVSHAAAH